MFLLRLSLGQLQVDGELTYNGHPFTDFVPQRTAAYVNQFDEVSPLHRAAQFCFTVLSYKSDASA